MVIGHILIGMIVGFLTAAASLILGTTILGAIGIYVLVGTTGTLIVPFIIVVRPFASTLIEKWRGLLISKRSQLP